MNTTLWILNTVGLLAVTVGVLFVFLHLHRTSRAVDTQLLPSVCQPLVKDRKMLTFTVGLMAAWFVIHYVAILFT